MLLAVHTHTAALFSWLSALCIEHDQHLNGTVLPSFQARLDAKRLERAAWAMDNAEPLIQGESPMGMTGTALPSGLNCLVSAWSVFCDVASCWRVCYMQVC